MSTSLHEGHELDSNCSLAHDPNHERGSLCPPPPPRRRSPQAAPAPRPEPSASVFARRVRRSRAAAVLPGLVAFALAWATAPAPAHAQSSDATLSGVSFQFGGSLSPEFSSTTYSYMVGLPSTQTGAAIQVFTSSDAATVRIDPDDNRRPSSLQFAAVSIDSPRTTRTVTVTVTAEDDTEQVYTFLFIRGPVPTHDLTLPSPTRLSSLQASAATVMTEGRRTPVPGEDCGCAVRYEAVVPREVSDFTLWVRPKSGVAIDIRYVNRTREDEYEGGGIRGYRLLEGTRNEIIVWATSGSTEEIYRVLVHRADRPPVLQRMFVYRGDVMLDYDRELRPDGPGTPGPAAPPADAFTVTVDGTEVDVTHTEISSKRLRLRLDTKARPPSEVKVSYAIPSTNPVQTARYGLAAAFSDRLAPHGGLGELKVSVADARATEGRDATADFWVSVSPRQSQTVTVDYATSDGTATAGEDYTARSATLTLNPGQNLKKISIPVLNDDHEDGGETFTLTLSNPTATEFVDVVLVDSVATGTINNDDPAPELSVSDGSATEGDAVEFTVSLSEASSEQVTVAYATSGGTAVSGTDFTAESGTLTFAANDTSKTVRVVTTDDSSYESDEMFTLTLSNPAYATLDTATATATGTIVDDDEELTASFGGMPASHTGEPFTFQLTFSEEPHSLGYQKLRDDAFAVTGGAVQVARRLQKGSGQAWNITVDPSGRDDVTITLPATTDCSASGAICTEDGRPLSHSESATVAGPVPTVSVSGASATEGDTVEFTVLLSEASSRQVTVAYATSGGTAASGTDFTAESGTLTFAGNETSKTVSVATTDDSSDESDETFTLTLSSPANATLGTATATGTIVDDDEQLTASFGGMPASHTGE
ncbi:MAG: cadherin-like beta sandwich domain-containing protein, partial [Gemmatimonadetes bacterium]|nr:cadherin-like beta sandwich domain-containing protein [Gemmatimonadota bacterium]